MIIGDVHFNNVAEYRKRGNALCFNRYLYFSLLSYGSLVNRACERAHKHTHTVNGFLLKSRTQSFAAGHNGREEASFTYSQSYKPHYFSEFLYVRVILCFISDLYLVITCEFNDATSHTR